MSSFHCYEANATKSQRFCCVRGLRTGAATAFPSLRPLLSMGRANIRTDQAKGCGPCLVFCMKGGENGRPRRTDRARPGCLPCARGGHRSKIERSFKGIRAERTTGPPNSHAWRVPALGGGEREGVGRSPRPCKPDREAKRAFRRSREKEKGPRRGPAGLLPPGKPYYTTSPAESQSPKSRWGGDALTRPKSRPLMGRARTRQPQRRRSRAPRHKIAAGRTPGMERRRAEAGAQTRKGDPPRGSPQTGGALAADRKRGRRAQARAPARPAGRAPGGAAAANSNSNARGQGEPARRGDAPGRSAEGRADAEATGRRPPKPGPLGSLKYRF